jgi:hypothetical protein
MGKTKSSARLDGWANILTGLNQTSRDKRLAGAYERGYLHELEAEELWRGNDMAARVVETVPGDIARAGWAVHVGDETKQDAAERPERESRTDAGDGDGKEISEATDAALDDLNAIATFKTAMEYARGYGGSAILLGARDGAKTLVRPLNLDTVQSVDFLTVLRPLELWPRSWYSVPSEAKFGTPETYWLQEDTAGATSSARYAIHETRLIRFDGVVVSKRQLRANRGWGDSYLNRVHAVLRDFDTSWDGAAILLHDFAQAVFKMKGLADLIANDEDDLVVKRARLIDLTRSVARAVLIDSEEEFERKATPITGMADLLDRFCNRLAAAARMPVTILMGQAPAGLNATGASDTRAYYDSVDAERTLIVRPRANRLLRVVFRSRRGPTRGVEPKNWMLEFGELWQATETEKAEVRLKQSQADVAYVTAGVLTPSEVAISRWGGDRYSTDTHLDLEARAAFEVKAPEEAAKEAAAAKAEAAALQTSAKPGAEVPAAAVG